MLDAELIEPILSSFVDRLADRLEIPQKISSSLKFGELFALYYERHIMVRHRKERNVQSFYRIHVRRWENVEVHKITRREVQAWVDETGANSHSASMRALDTMRAVINWGIRRELIPAMINPCTGIERFTMNSRERFLTPDELIRLKTSLDYEPDRLRDFFWLCLLTGARKGNVLAMRWDRIDLGLATWTIPADEHKNGESHIVPLGALSLAILQRRMERRCDSPWVFPGRRPGDHLREPGKSWQRIVNRAEIPDVRIHDLRRTLASYMAINGENQYVIAQMLGHKDVRSTAIYARLNIEAVREAAESVGEKWKLLLTLPKSQPVLKLESRGNVAPQTKPTKNASVRLNSAEQIMVEAKILSSLRSGGSTKKCFYRKIGKCFQVNHLELTRILEEMEHRFLINRIRDDWGQVRYELRTAI